MNSFIFMMVGSGLTAFLMAIMSAGFIAKMKQGQVIPAMAVVPVVENLGEDGLTEEDLAYCPVMEDEDSCGFRKSVETVGNVYCRLESYFRTARPFLDSELSIQDVSKKLFTNKAYVSLAVKRYAGLNFCQYVNRYRIFFAVETFHCHPDMRLCDLTSLSGFNSAAAFNISFRCFMHISPREWCHDVISKETEKEADATPTMAVASAVAVS